MKKNQVVAIFNRDIKRGIPENDKPMLCEAWNNFIDSLVKQGLVTESQAERWVQPF